MVNESLTDIVRQTLRQERVKAQPYINEWLTCKDTHQTLGGGGGGLGTEYPIMFRALLHTFSVINCSYNEIARGRGTLPSNSAGFQSGI